ncbi:DUF1983 domain-containing protein, partial [Streptomyces sp. NPDC047974]|uniref:phage tail tip fiber protein n=1 Tax=Streptomyces sp. NPDC047974 TaxID=3154343 RepID=UPI0034109820
AYDVEWRRDDLNWVRAGRVGTTSCEVRGIYAGKYLARVRAVNALNAVSQPALSMLTDIKGKTEPPPALTSLTTTPVVFGIQLAWGFPPGATDTERTEIWRSTGPDRASATKFADFAYPQNRYQLDGLAAGARFYFWGRLVDKSGNIGPWYPTGTGVMGEASTNQSDYDAYLSGRITESALGQDLLSKIESIDQIVPLIWEAGATYDPGDTVVHNGKIWLWNDNAPGNEEPPGTKWKDVGDAVAQAGAVVGRVNTLELQVNDPETGLQAIGQKTDGLFAQLDVQAAGDSDWGAGDATVFAGTLTIQTVIAEGDYAQAQRTDTVEAKVGETQALVQENSQAVVDMDGRISASWTLKLQVAANGQYYAAGMGIGIENQPDGSYQSQILFQADRFAVINLVNGQVTSPFVIQGGQTFISQALIGTGWIQNAMIGDVIQSTAVGAGGLPRWKLDKNGSLAMNGPVGGGSLSINDQNIFVRSPTGQPLVALGDGI